VSGHEKSDWQKPADASADPARVRHFLDLLEEAGAGPRLEARDHAGALAELRRFKQREMLRIAARDLARSGNVVKIIREISDVAGACLQAVWQVCRDQITARFGTPFQQDADGNWRRADFCVLGMGKLGGQELNYSSSVDLLFLYSDEGDVFRETPVGRKTPRAVMSNHQYFCKLAETFTGEVSRVAPEGMLYRVVDSEFIAQALCLENGWLQANTLCALERAREAGVLPDPDKLLDNYRKLRCVVGILRRWSYEGETVLPDDPAPYYRVSVRCGFATPEAFRKAVAGWRQAIREVYAKVFKEPCGLTKRP
jgi:glutamine synthetase adenylyltransferase